MNRRPIRYVLWRASSSRMLPARARSFKLRVRVTQRHALFLFFFFYIYIYNLPRALIGMRGSGATLQHL